MGADAPLARAQGADPASPGATVPGIASRRPVRSSRTPSRRRTRSPTPRSPATRRSSATSWATSSSRSSSSRCCWRSRETGDLDTSRARSTRSSSGAILTCSARPRPAPPGACASAGRRSRRSRKGGSGVFHDVPETLPALLLARKVQRRAAAVGYDWPDLDGPAAKVQRGARRAARGARARGPARARDRAGRRVEAELGDLLFTVVNLARFVNVDPELALRATTGRFRERVELAERLAAEAGETWAGARPGAVRSAGTSGRRRLSAPPRQLGRQESRGRAAGGAREA